MYLFHTILIFSFPKAEPSTGFHLKQKKKHFINLEEDAIHRKPLAIPETLYVLHRLHFPANINSILLVKRFSVFSGVQYRELFESNYSAPLKKDSGDSYDKFIEDKYNIFNIQSALLLLFIYYLFSLWTLICYQLAGNLTFKSTTGKFGDQDA